MGYIQIGLGSPSHGGSVARSGGILVGMPWKCNTLAGNTMGLAMWRLPTPDTRGSRPQAEPCRALACPEELCRYLTLVSPPARKFRFTNRRNAFRRWQDWGKRGTRPEIQSDTHPPGHTMNADQEALCLFFAHSPMERHREWVLSRLNQISDRSRGLVLMRLSEEPLWDRCGTDRANGIGSMLELLNLCNVKIRQKTAQIGTI